jgi:hypothetical protein
MLQTIREKPLFRESVGAQIQDEICALGAERPVAIAWECLGLAFGA